MSINEKFVLKKTYSSFKNVYERDDPMRSLDVPPLLDSNYNLDPNTIQQSNLQASGRRKLGEFKLTNNTFNYNQEIVLNEEQKNSYNPMNQMNSVFYHNKSMSRRGLEQQPDLPGQEETNDKQEIRRIYRVSF